MFALPWNKVVLRRGGIELNPNAQLLPVPRARRYRDPPVPQEEPPVAKARMERAEAKAAMRMELPYALPYMHPNDRANAGDQIAIHQIRAGPPPPKRSNAANPLPEPAAREFSKAGAPLPPPTISPSVLANVIAIEPAAVPGGDANGVLANVLAIAPFVAPPAAGIGRHALEIRAKAASLPPSRALAPAVYEDLMRRARALDERNAGLDEPRTYNPHPVSY
jgi:hypothetical protein